MERIDGFAHALPFGFVDWMTAEHPSEALAALAGSPQFWDVDRRLADLDEFGIDRQVIALGRPSILDGLSHDAALPAVRRANDGIRALADEAPDRLIPVGTLPFLTEDYLDEFDRCVDDLGLAGVQLFTVVDGQPIDDPAHRPVFERAVAQDVPIWLHPRTLDWFDWPDEHGISKMFGWPFDTAVALVRLAIGGTLERFPELTIVSHHMGGMVPHFSARIESVAGAAGHDIDAVFDRLRGVLVDTALNGADHALACGYDFYGADNVVFATDYPFGREGGRWFMRSCVRSVEALDVTARDRRRIFGGNLAEVL